MEISVGAILEGTIKSITKFGAFVSLPGGRSGLVHISEIAHSYVAVSYTHLDVYKRQMVTCSIIPITFLWFLRHGLLGPARFGLRVLYHKMCIRDRYSPGHRAGTGWGPVPRLF